MTAHLAIGLELALYPIGVVDQRLVEALWAAEAQDRTAPMAGHFGYARSGPLAFDKAH